MDQNEIFDQAEELVGTRPSGDGLRNAIHAVITILNAQGLVGNYRYKMGAISTIKSVEYLARNYEVARPTHMHMGVMGQGMTCQYAMEWGYAENCDQPTN